MTETNGNTTENGHEEGTFLAQVDTWRFVAGIAFVASMVLVIFSIYLWTQLNNTVDRLDAVVHARLVEAETSDRESVLRCFSSASQGPALRRALRGLESVVKDPEAQAALRNLRRTSVANSSTIRDCRNLAKKLKVSIPKEGS